MPEGKLIICPTPIGNLKDLSFRVLDALGEADCICAEDTRVTARLLAAQDIEKRIERLDEEILSKRLEAILERIRNGEVLAYCSDAGMPGVSDPGLRLVDAARKAALPVEVLPGPSAEVTAYVASGFVCPHYYFGAFLPRRSREQSSLLLSLKTLNAVLVFYESPMRLCASLAVIVECFPEREVAVCRELTKLHEEVIRLPSREILEVFTERTATSSIKGEIVVVIGPPTRTEQDTDAKLAEMRARERTRECIESGAYTNKDIVTLLQQEFGIPKNAAYDITVSERRGTSE